MKSTNALSPPTVITALAPIPVRPLLPLSEPPASHTPAPPSPARPSSFGFHFTLSTHIVPAAYPRSTTDVPCPTPLPPSGDGRKAAAAAICERLQNDAELHAQGRLKGERSVKPLWSSVYCYRRGPAATRGSTKGLTLFFAHATGFPKEIWEPVLSSLAVRLDAPGSKVRVDEIWTWEAVQHGDSALVNEANLGGVYDWNDNTRDILNFLLHYLPASPHTAPPAHLHRLSPTEASGRAEHGFAERTIVAVGHSFGGCTSLLAALHVPALFSSLVLIDPIIEHPSRYQHSPLPGAVKRRTHWPSLEDARAQFAATPFFRTWHPAVLATYVAHALAPDPAVPGGVRLKTSGMQEATVFADLCTSWEAFDLLPTLDPRVALHWIMPGDVPTWGSPDAQKAVALARERVWRRPANASNARVMKAGHLIPQEAPEEFADELYAFLARKYGAEEIHLKSRL